LLLRVLASKLFSPRSDGRQRTPGARPGVRPRPGPRPWWRSWPRRCRRPCRCCLCLHSANSYPKTRSIGRAVARSRRVARRRSAGLLRRGAAGLPCPRRRGVRSRPRRRVIRAAPCQARRGGRGGDASRPPRSLPWSFSSKLMAPGRGSTPSRRGSGRYLPPRETANRAPARSDACPIRGSAARRGRGAGLRLHCTLQRVLASRSIRNSLVLVVLVIPCRRALVQHRTAVAGGTRAREPAPQQRRQVLVGRRRRRRGRDPAVRCGQGPGRRCRLPASCAAEVITRAPATRQTTSWSRSFCHRRGLPTD
jgi:hypothetical protein